MKSCRFVLGGSKVRLLLMQSCCSSRIYAQQLQQQRTRAVAALEQDQLDDVGHQHHELNKFWAESPSVVVKQVLESVHGAPFEGAPDDVSFQGNVALKFKVLEEVSQRLGSTIPSSVLNKVNTAADVIEFYERPSFHVAQYEQTSEEPSRPLIPHSQHSFPPLPTNLVLLQCHGDIEVPTGRRLGRPCQLKFDQLSAVEQRKEYLKEIEFDQVDEQEELAKAVNEEDKLGVWEAIRRKGFFNILRARWRQDDRKS